MGKAEFQTAETHIAKAGNRHLKNFVKEDRVNRKTATKGGESRPLPAGNRLLISGIVSSLKAKVTVLDATVNLNPLPVEPKEERMNQEIATKYVTQLKREVPQYFDNQFDITAIIYDKGTIIQLLEKPRASKNSPIIKTAGKIDEACKLLHFNLREFVPESEIGSIIPAKGTTMFYGENKIYILKENDSRLFERPCLEADLKKINKGYHNILA